MAKKISVKKSVIKTPVRNTVVPPKSAAAPMARKAAPAYDQIARRAYEMWQATGAGELDNWFRAERELIAA